MSARSCLAALAFVGACAAPATTSVHVARVPQSSLGAPVASTTTAAPASAAVGTSDGVSCEEAQAENAEVTSLQGGDPPDLTVSAFASTLNAGTYLEPCGVPNSSKVNICVAIKGGLPLGVTVALDPADPEIEVCVAKQVRAKTFTSHPKLDVVRVRF